MEKEKGLNPNQEKFCILYATDREFFGHGVNSYSEAYNIPLKDLSAYNVCKQSAHRLLTNVDILSRINELLEDSGLNDSFVDKQMLFLITQNADLQAKGKMIDSYNKLKARISDKITHSLDESVGEISINIKRNK
jgi:hypothetical protein